MRRREKKALEVGKMQWDGLEEGRAARRQAGRELESGAVHHGARRRRGSWG